jgi:hypothetical protein
VCAASIAARYARGGIVWETEWWEKLTCYMLQLSWIATKRCSSCSLTSSSCLRSWALANNP